MKYTGILPTNWTPPFWNNSPQTVHQVFCFLPRLLHSYSRFFKTFKAQNMLFRPQWQLYYQFSTPTTTTTSFLLFYLLFALIFLVFFVLLVVVFFVIVVILVLLPSSSPCKWFVTQLFKQKINVGDSTTFADLSKNCFTEYRSNHFGLSCDFKWHLISNCTTAIKALSCICSQPNSFFPHSMDPSAPSLSNSPVRSVTYLQVVIFLSRPLLTCP